MSEFKQIIGRGTRLRDDYGKLWFNILDYTGSATRMFADPTFDGGPTRITEEQVTEDGETTSTTAITPEGEEPSPHLNIGSLRKFPFILPTLDEQLRIVSGLDALQRKVDAVEALQAHTAAELEALLPAVLDKAFKGELLGDEAPALLELRA